MSENESGLNGINALLCKAVKDQNTHYMRQWLDAGADPNFADGENRMTPLHFAAVHCYRPAIRLLLSTGKCDFTKKDGLERIAAEIAATSGQDAAVTRLLFKKFREQYHDNLARASEKAVKID